MPDREILELREEIEMMKAELAAVKRDLTIRPREFLRRLLAGQRVRIGLGVAVVAIPLAAYASTVSIPNTFANGTVADATEVNANFGAVKVAVDDNDSRIGALEAVGGDITGVVAGSGLLGGATSGEATLSVDGSQFVETAGDTMTGQLDVNAYVRAFRFVDLNDTSYSVDPASTSYLNDMRANIFYDRNNTGYYGDFASTSRFNESRSNTHRATTLCVGDWNGGDCRTSWPAGDNLGDHIATTTLDMSTQAITGFGRIEPFGPGNDSNQASHGYGIFQEDGSWNFPYPDLRIAYHTGIKIGANKAYEGIRFYNNSDMATETMSVSDGDDDVRIYFGLRVPRMYDLNDTSYYIDPASTSYLNDMRANIFYDRNNTGYYVDPSSTSNMLTVRASTFFDRDNLAFYLDPAGSSVLNTVTKSAGSFEITHPDPAKAEGGWRLRHSFVESPTRGDNLYRFTVTVEDGVAKQKLPDYFPHLNENAQIWVSPVEHFGSAFGKLDDACETLTIRAKTDGKYHVLVVATRKDEAAVAFWDAKGTEYQEAQQLAGESAERLAEAECTSSGCPGQSGRIF